MYAITGTRKSKCPFKQKGRPKKDAKGWWLKVMCGIHNHEAAKTLVGHAYVGQLTIDEKSLVENMAKNAVAPRNMLLSLKDQNPDNLTTINQVFSFCQSIRRTARGSLTEMQHLMKLLTRDKYVHWQSLQEDSEVLRDIFLIHPDAIQLFNTFPIVIVIDSTYKPNKYKILLLEMVGITLTGMSFYIAFAYLIFELTYDFIWVLSKMKGLILKMENCPQVIVTDKDNALVNAVVVVFPTS
ncbi:protein FAR1-RELATED SEQUENCE 5-like [Lotus japonicus]|uniref:protein FAR1-RELATED SEQUENCE 5-like n=1 Tax=Lotus japonicus TaxID=34305 RepID=UPI00258A3AB9|nr:protein FAR1-RELATED SEQUENCE 5-like [Lotus japonicus]